MTVKNIHVIKLDNLSTAEDALAVLTDSLVSHGWAKPGVQEAVIEREKQYPTGLHTPSLDVAMPHADAEWTIEPAIIVGSLDKPVPFRPMDGSPDSINAQLIFLIAIPEGQKHIKLLQGLTRLFSSDGSLIQLHKTPTKEVFESLLTNAINNLAP